MDFYVKRKKSRKIQLMNNLRLNLQFKNYNYE